MKDLKAIKGRYFISRLIQEGEHEHQDFKFQISDARKIARSISAFANNDGGRLLIGVKDNGAIAGVRSEEDLYMIEAAAETFCRPSVKVEFTAYRCDEGAVVYVAEIPRAEVRPVSVREEGNRLKAYYRVADENIAVPPLMVRAWQRAASGAPALLRLSEAEQALLHLLRANDTVDPDTFHITAHISRAEAEDAITRLASLSLVTFVYSHPRFLLKGS